ncbi:MAG: FG-GAP repeat protein [Candidatus Thermoplasmatota archaeon]|nr:FG-GAP repeat protein [Candidatus Thermoplasmatota archaeon]
MSRSPVLSSLVIMITLITSALPTVIGGNETRSETPASLDQDSYVVLGRDDTMSILGGESGVPFGSTVASGDLDGDGRGDIVIGAPMSRLGAGGGAVMVYFAREPDELFTLIGHYDADLVITAGDVDDWFGSSLLVEDLNLDGRDDLMIGAPFADGPLNGRRDSGEVYVITGRQRVSFGTSMQIDRVGLFCHVYGREGGDRLGTALEAGDLDDDGVPELVIRSEGHGGKADPVESEYDNECFGSWEIEVIKGVGTGIGTVDLSFSRPMVRYFGEAVVTADAYATHIGNGLAVGDFNGDSIGDLSFSYRFNGEGYAVIMLGGYTYPGVPLGTDIQVHQGTDFYPDVQFSLRSGGWEEASLTFADLGGGDEDDLVIGLPYAPGVETWRKKAGQFDIHIGRNVTTDIQLGRSDASTTSYGVDSSDLWGKTTLGADIDGDGYDELLVAAPGGDGVDNLEFDCGEAYLFDIDGSFPSVLTFQDSIKAYKGRSRECGAFQSMAASEMLIDGQEEVLISSPKEVVDLGPTVGTGLVSFLSQSSSFDASFVGQFNASCFGSAMVVEDFDQDGNDDLVVGDYLGGDPGRTGYAHMFFGEPAGWSGRYYAADSTDIRYNDAMSFSRFGWAMATGDLNNDGYPDLVVGAPSAQISGLYNDAGSVHIFWGGTRSYMMTRTNLTYTGYLVERIGSAIAVGDLNGDGIDDLAFGAPYDHGAETADRYHAGMVYIMFGPLSGTTSRSVRNIYDVKIIGTEDTEFIGETLAIDDMDGDGIGDLAIGAPKSKAGSITRQGVTYVLRGRSTWNQDIDLVTEPSLRIFGAWPYDEVGSSLVARDMDDDGKAELFLGSPSGDGFQRTVKEGGNLFILQGEFLASRMPSGTISLRTEFNVSVCGDQVNQRTGSSVDLGDIDGNGDLDVFIGAKGFQDPISGLVTGCVHVFPHSLLTSSLTINTSSLPLISGFMDNDEAGSALAGKDITGDGKYDLFIGAPGADPLLDGSSPGVVYLWEGKDLFSLSVRTQPLEISGAVEIAGPLDRPRDILAPGEGPYQFKVAARSQVGYEHIDTVNVQMMSQDAAGFAELSFDTSTKEFSIIATGDFEDQLMLYPSLSTGRTDGVQSWFVVFMVKVGWDLPDPDLIVTSTSGTVGSHSNYLNDEFVVDREIGLDSSYLKVLDPEGSPVKGWMKEDSEFNVCNVSLVHGTSGVPFGPNATRVEISLKRPDGITIGKAVMNGSFLDNITAVPGGGLYGRDLTYRLTNGTLPRGAEWSQDVTFKLNVDTVKPPPVSSFNIFPDGKESGISDVDDDQFIEVYWTEVSDQGGSGISNYTLRVLGQDLNIISEMDYLVPGDLIFLPGGAYTLSFFACDRAGNIGPFENRTLFLDINDPRFYGALPGDNAWINDFTNGFSIMVSDDGVGIDISSAMYRVFRSDVRILSDWMPVREITTFDGSVRLNATVPSANGFGNYIQWKVSDLAGQTSISLPFSYNMDINLPTIDIGDQDGMLVGPGSFSLGCYIEDTGSGLLLDSINYRIGSRDELYTLPWTDLGMSGAGASASPSVNVLPSYRGWGFGQWMVSDIAGNMVESDLVSIYIDDEMPVFNGFLPNGSTVLRDRDVMVTAFIMEEGSGLETSNVEFSYSTISGWVQFGVGGYSPWLKVDDLEDRGGGSYAASVEVLFDEGPFNQIKFRVIDSAGNGWVVSAPVKIEVAITERDLLPISVFTIYPAVDTIKQGDTIVLDGSVSYDPEGLELTYVWYSDLEFYPLQDSLGSGRVLNATLNTPGVHRIWLVVSDGKNVVESERYLLSVVVQDEESSGDGGNKGSIWDRFCDWFPLLLVSLLIGLIIGGLLVYLLIKRSRSGSPREPDQPLVDAVYEPDHFVPVCPYCGNDVRLTDEYCMKCGSVFTAEDKVKMEKAGKKKRGRKRKELLLKPGEEGLVEDTDQDLEEEPEELTEEDVNDEAEEIPVSDEEEDEEEEEVDEEDLDLYDEEDLEDLEMEEEDPDDEDEWEVGQ